MKTLKQWQKSGLDFDKYITKPCQVSKDIIDDLTYYVGVISDYNHKIIQVNEAYDSDKNEQLRYTTFIEKESPAMLFQILFQVFFHIFSGIRNR